MGAVTAVSRALGFVRVLVVAAVLGTTYLGNAFQAANSVSNVLFELLAAGALSAVLVPTLVGLLDAGDRAAAERVAGGVLGVALSVLGVVAFAGVVGAPWLARLLTAGVPAEVAGEQRELVTYLLRFFVPQVLLYAAGTVATAALYACRRFTVTAAAPIGNTVVMVACLVAFRAAAGGAPGFDLSTAERLLLVAAGTGGVLAFVGSLLVACAAAGFRLRPRWPRGDERVAAALRHSGWGVVLHTGAGILLGTAIVAGSAVEGGVVAYQVGWVFFLAPYGVLAQPIHTAILPELVGEAADPDAFARSVRWALERMALLVVPVAAGMVALAMPGMRLVSFGETTSAGAGLLAAAVAGLGLGLLPYSAFLLLARASYALGDSRTPGTVALAGAGVGAVVMAGAAIFADGGARIAWLGVGHSLAYLVGTAVLARRLHDRLGRSFWPSALGRVVAVAAVVGLVAWAVPRSLDLGPDRLTDLAVVTAALVLGVGTVLTGYRALGVTRALTPRVARATTTPVTAEPLP